MVWCLVFNFCGEQQFIFINVEFSALVPTLSIVRWSFTSDLLVKRLIDKIFIVENKIILWWFMGGSKET